MTNNDPDDVEGIDVDVDQQMVAFRTTWSDGQVRFVHVSRENLQLAVDALDGKVERSTPAKRYAVKPR